MIAGDFTQLRTVVLSEFRVALSLIRSLISVFFNASEVDQVKRANMTAPHNSFIGTVLPLIEATFPLAHINLVSIIDSSALLQRTYTTHP